MKLYPLVLLSLVLSACSSAPDERKFPIYYCSTPMGVAQIDTATLGLSAEERDGRLIVNDDTQTISFSLAHCVARVVK